MAMGGNGDDKVIGLKRSVISDLLEENAEPELPPARREWVEKSDARPKREPPPPGEDRAAAADAAATPLEELAPLPRAGDPYKAHARLANKPLATIFFLAGGQLPDGFSYAILERVWMAEPQKPGGSPDLLMRFNGSVVTEVRVEGRNLLALCEHIGRHLVHWIREHPGGRDTGDGGGAFIRRIAIREFER